MTNTIYIHQPEKAVSFTRLPNFLFEAPTFTPLSNEAKVLYAFILRRTELDVYKRQAQVISNKNVPELNHCAAVRHTEHRNRAQNIRYAHP